MATLDELEIKLTADAKDAADSIDKLIGKLSGLSTSLTSINGSKIDELGKGVQSLATGMQSLKGRGSGAFKTLSENINTLASINASGLEKAAVALTNIATSFSGISAISSSNAPVQELVVSISKLGSVSVTRALENLPKLATAINNLMITLSRAPRVSQNVIDMTNALANLSAQGNRVGSASKMFEVGMNRTTTSVNRTKKSFKGLASTIGKFYATYFMFIRGFKALWKSIGSTADYVESFNYYTVSFGKIASKWDEEWGNYGDENARNYSNAFVTTMNDTFKKLSGVSYDPKTGLLSETGLKNLGLNIQEVTNYAAQLASMMDSIGQNGQVTLATTKAFVKLAGDISSLKNIDYSDAANKIQSVLMGQSRAGYSLGWDTTMASLQATADSLNLSKSVSEMAQFEKQQLRILTILEQSRVVYGDQSNTINTLSNQIRLFRNNTKEAGLLVGQLFTPIMVNLMPVINGVTIALKRMLSYLGIALGANMKNVSQGFNDTEDSAFDMSEEIDGATESLKEYKNQAMGFDEINPIKDVNASVNVNGSVGSSIDLTDEILKATEAYEKAWKESYDNMESRSQEIANRIVNGFKNSFKNAGWYGVGNYISSGIADSLSNADFDSVHKGLENVARNIANFLNGLITPDLLGNVGTSFAKSLNAVINAKATLGEEINFDQVGEAIATGINNFFDTFDFERLGESINTWVQGLAKALVKAIQKIDWSDVLKGLGDLITELDTETLAILGGLGLLRSGGLKSLIFGNGINLGGTGGAGGATTGGFNLNSLLFGKNLGGGISFGNAGLFGTLALGIGAGKIGTEGGRILNYLMYGDAEAALNYDIKDAVLYIKNAEMYELAEAFDKLFGISAAKNIQEGEVIDNKLQAEIYKAMGEAAELKTWAYENKEFIQKDSVTSSLIEKYIKLYYPDFDKKTFEFGQLRSFSGRAGSGGEIGGTTIPQRDTDYIAGAKDKANVTDDEWANFFENELPQIKKEQGRKAMLSFLEGFEEASSGAGAMATATSNIANHMLEMYGKLSGKAKDQGKGLVWNLGNGITINQNQATSAFGTLSNALSSTINSKYQALRDSVLGKGKSIAWNFGNGITINKDTAINPIKDLFTKITGIELPEKLISKFKEFGKNIVQGLIKGLSDKPSLLELTTKVTNLGGSVASVFANTLDIHSPSRLFEDYAINTIQGYNLGIEKYAPTTVDTMEDWSGMIADANMSLEPQYLGNANSEEILLLRQQNMLLQALLNKETVEIKGDAKQIFKVVQKQANNYTIQTGEPAFI